VGTLATLLSHLERGVFYIPKRWWSGSIVLNLVYPLPAPQPAFFLVEVYALGPLPGDYGLGRTIRTFTLFPGESTEITARTWRTTTHRDERELERPRLFQSRGG
jgi:hypothetical protein